MSLDFELKDFGDFRIVVLRENITGKERKVCQYTLGEKYVSNIICENGVEAVAGELENGVFREFRFGAYVPTAVKRNLCLALSLDGLKCLVDLDKSEILVPVK